MSSMTDITTWQQSGGYDRPPGRVGFYEQPTTSSVIEGIPDEQRTSPVRRTFCLLVLFDLGLSFILWIIYAQLIGYGSVVNAMRHEIVNYTFETSMFDTVLIAFWRFILLEIAYAACNSKRPWCIAVTTLGTNVAVIVKCFYYDFSHKSSTKTFEPLDCALLILCFVMSWVETVFLEYRVIPQEKAARQVIDRETERTALLFDGRPRSEYSQSEHYFSPVASPHDSEDEEEQHTRPGSRSAPELTSKHLSTEDVDGMKERGRQTAELAWNLYADDKWTPHGSGGDPIKGCVFHRNVPSIGKVFKLESIVEGDAKRIFMDLVENVEASTEWNHSIVKCQRIDKIASNIDIIHNVCAEALRGAIAPRDFVLLRYWENKGGVYMLASLSVSHPGCPPTKQPIRGVNNLGAIILERLPEEPRHCKFIWLLHTDIKGWLPQNLVDKAMNGVLTDFVAFVRIRLATLDARQLAAQNSLPPPETRNNDADEFPSLTVLSSRSDPNLHRSSNQHHRASSDHSTEDAFLSSDET